ncbi:PAS domain S-box protein [filamentous cyanobacterium LEGE 11480]|uniref:histidine kinase n=1 Tax=Romeriopsis navalis LEGE 11480 TaxID=2777977 RepID=A0A928VR18_9CYAN|nr:PAS domain S-box protein [Romeriopsis navalis]MBE9031376.1 PAS domain S-box protein [Romeriopsis navalis LEGE 11480]
MSRLLDQYEQILLDSIIDLVIVQSADGICEYASPSAQALLGIDANTLIGQRFEDLMHPDDAMALQRLRVAIGEFPDQFSHRHRLRHQHDGYLWVETVSQKRYTETDDCHDGKPKIVTISRDITARKQIEDEVTQLNQDLEQRIERRTEALANSVEQQKNLLKSESQARQIAETAQSDLKIYQDIVENIQTGLMVWRWHDPEDIESFRLVAANPRSSTLLRRDMQLMIGKTLTEGFPERARNTERSLHAIYVRVIQTQQAETFEEVCPANASRDEQIYTLKVFPLPDRCVGVGLDNVTQPRYAEKALALSQQRYATVVNNVQEVIFQLDCQGRWLLLNQAWENLTGLAIVDCLGRHYADMDWQHDVDVEHVFQQLITGKIESYSYEAKLMNHDGDLRIVQIDLIQGPIDDTEVSVLGTINDVTERQAAAMRLQARADELSASNAALLATTIQLQHRNAELDQFAYVASHDLKAPLRAISNLSSWLEEDLADSLTPDTQTQMSLLRHRVKRMDNLIDGLLLYSRVGHSKGDLKRIDLRQLLEETLQLMVVPDGVAVQISAHLPVIQGYELPLQQIFMNLLSNALKHGLPARDGRITVSSIEQGDYYAISIKDNGPGIEPQYHDRIFQIFQTLEARDQSENTGIGLAIVKKLVEAEGGKISINSVKDQGTQFTFTWPKHIVES